jgi:S-adenosylmethionine:tRNA ribosyltransferase-isomerase
VRTEDFDYDLPAASIAQQPAPRGESRLLVLDREGAERNSRISDLPRLLRPTDLLVLNDTRVIPARLVGRSAGGGKMEILLLEKVGERDWEALVKPGKRARPGAVIEFDGIDWLGAEVILKREDGAAHRYLLRFSEPIEPHLDRLGHVPLPPYIHRPDTDEDRERYQTVFARSPGAIAAPTAGLHFSEALLREIEGAGIETARVTLHVGLGTFKPVAVEQVAEHRMESERYAIGEEAAAAIRKARREGRRVVAVGTTVVRTLESAALADPEGEIRVGSGATTLFITPGFRFRAVDVLLTNFHLPRSTLLMLVSAFAGRAGRERVLAAYREAVREGYRFYSYGDAMLVERASAGA